MARSAKYQLRMAKEPFVPYQAGFLPPLYAHSSRPSL